MSILLDPTFLVVAFGHLIVDILNGQRAVLLTYWSTELGFSNATLALIATIAVWVTAPSQVVFGWLTDRFGKTRLMVTGGIFWICGFTAAALFLPTMLAIPCLVLASFGSATFHPAGAAAASLRGLVHLQGRETTAASFFFLFGSTGAFLGPIIGGTLLAADGPVGLIYLAVLALPVGLAVLWRMDSSRKNMAFNKTSMAPRKPRLVVPMSYLISLGVITLCESWVLQNMGTFIPKYLSDQGQTAATYGLVAGLMMGGAALGNVVGAFMADRIGKQRVVLIMFFASSLPILLLSFIKLSLLFYALVVLGGFLIGAVDTVLIVLAQQCIDGGAALASGLILAFMFCSGSLGSLLSGFLIDRLGYAFLFQSMTGLAVIGSLLSLLLVKFAPAKTPQVAPAQD
jgi:FSR family fosmidomycin resistance protein-like MFS transporter